MTPGEEFVRALVAKDAHGLKELLSPGVDFKALTPGRFWESDSVDEIVDETLLRGLARTSCTNSNTLAR